MQMQMQMQMLKAPKEKPIEILLRRSLLFGSLEHELFTRRPRVQGRMSERNS